MDSESEKCIWYLIWANNNKPIKSIAQNFIKLRISDIENFFRISKITFQPYLAHKFNTKWKSIERRLFEYACPPPFDLLLSAFT